MKPGGQRLKGSRVERELVELHLEQGIPCKRVPLSGAQAGWEGDLLIAGTMKGEVKARRGGAGFKVLEQWLVGNDVLFLRKDRSPPFVAMTFGSYIRLLKALVMSQDDLSS